MAISDLQPSGSKNLLMASMETFSSRQDTVLELWTRSAGPIRCNPAWTSSIKDESRIQDSITEMDIER